MVGVTSYLSRMTSCNLVLLQLLGGLHGGMVVNAVVSQQEGLEKSIRSDNTETINKRRKAVIDRACQDEATTKSLA